MLSTSSHVFLTQSHVILNEHAFRPAIIACNGFEKFDSAFSEDYCWTQGLYTVKEAYDLIQSAVPYPGLAFAICLSGSCHGTRQDRDVKLETRAIVGDTAVLTAATVVRARSYTAMIGWESWRGVFPRLPDSEHARSVIARPVSSRTTPLRAAVLC